MSQGLGDQRLELKLMLCPYEDIASDNEAITDVSRGQKVGMVSRADSVSLQEHNSIKRENNFFDSVLTG
jgi:hypothetical protein